MSEVEQRTAWLKVNEKVDVALRAVIASGDRTEDGDRSAVMATHEFRDLVAKRLNLLETCAHNIQVTESPDPSGPLSSRIRPTTGLLRP